NKLVWEASHSDNYLETLAKIEYPDMSSKIVKVGLFRNPANQNLDGVDTYGMKIDNAIIREQQYTLLRKFAEYMFLDDLK
ncbi:hypothetical protein HYX19_01340, partial [Candidatus Woesearchaeota archaeon]|nr:hypothetical protein [Candidatus Woesearchaeota archaeon]